jgi:hypothetical protein
MSDLTAMLDTEMSVSNNTRNPPQSPNATEPGSSTNSPNMDYNADADSPESPKEQRIMKPKRR